MSQLVRLLKNAGRVTGRPTAGFGSHQDAPRKRLLLVAALDGADAASAKKAIDAGADAIEVTGEHGSKTLDQLKDLIKSVSVPVGMRLPGSVPANFDFQALAKTGIDYVKVEAGDVPATVFLIEGPVVVLEVKESFSEIMLKMLNFLPAKIVQVDSPEDIQGFSVKRLMEARVDRELVGKPLLMNVGNIKPEAAQLLALIAPNGLVVPGAEVAAWKDAVANLKEPEEDEDYAGPISLRAPTTAA